ncbi:hypothetical protein M8C21_030570, partial [Ambrosia artemisiifolia]
HHLELRVSLKLWTFSNLQLNLCTKVLTCFACDIPSRKSMLLQIYVAMKAMRAMVLSTFHSLSESQCMVENGWTRCFSRISDVGCFSYAFNLCLYLVLVEFRIYRMHRELHGIKPLFGVPSYRWDIASSTTCDRTISTIWTASIHDCVDGKIWSVMGATRFITRLIVIIMGFLQCGWTGCLVHFVILLIRIPKRCDLDMLLDVYAFCGRNMDGAFMDGPRY